MKTKIEGAIILFGALLVVGCSDKTPEVNETNCKIANINQIKDAEIRASFAQKCFHSGEVVDSPARHKSY